MKKGKVFIIILLCVILIGLLLALILHPKIHPGYQISNIHSIAIISSVYDGEIEDSEKQVPFIEFIESLELRDIGFYKFPNMSADVYMRLLDEEGNTVHELRFYGGGGLIDASSSQKPRYYIGQEKLEQLFSMLEVAHRWEKTVK